MFTLDPTYVLCDLMYFDLGHMAVIVVLFDWKPYNMLVWLLKQDGDSVLLHQVPFFR